MGRPSMRVTIRYFAWLRERIGRAVETVELPAGVDSPRAVIAWLRSRGDEYQTAFERPEIIRVAIDQHHASMDAPIANAREIAFFPPVTGG